MKKKTLDEFINLANKIHHDKYKYDKSIYIDMNTKIEIICPKHGSFWQTPNSHLRGCGCKICNKIEKRRKSKAKLMEDIYKVHGDKYDYSKMIYENNKKKVKIICPIHGEFEQAMDKHLQGQGCPKCAKNCSDTKESFIEKAKKIHGDKYDYSKINYINSQTKVEIIDPNYGSFWITPNSHLNGRGSWIGRKDKINKTKRKNNTFHASSTEKKVKKRLCDYFGKDDILTEYSSEDYPFNCDFYIKSLDLYIEINVYFSHGGHFYDSNNVEDVKKYELWKKKSEHSTLYKKAIYVWVNRDLLKRKTALQNNLNYLVFWRYDLADFDEWLNNFNKTKILSNVK